MEENQTIEETTEKRPMEKYENSIKHCFHKFVKFKGYRRCIKCGMEIDK